MKRLLHTVAFAPPSQILFEAERGAITAGRIRSIALQLEPKLSDAQRIYLHTASASLFVAGLLAASRKSLAVYCPAHLQPEYLREIEADKHAVLTDQDVASFATIHLAHSDDDGAAAPIDVAGDLDLFFYTSGVTGKPKPVPKNIAQLDAEASVLEQLWPMGAQRVVGTVSHQHIYGMLFRIFWPLVSGGVSADKSADYWEQLERKLSPETTLVTGPAHLMRLPAAANFVAGHPRLVFSSGAPLPITVAHSAREHFGSLPIEVLGSTETGGIAWRRQDREDALWTPFPGVRTASDLQGNLRVHSPFASSGEPVLTGDIAAHVGENFRLMGRGDRIIKINGKRVSLARVEERLLRHPFIESAAAVDLPERKGDLGAVVHLNPDGIAALAQKGAFRLSRDIRRALAVGLEPSERPKHWRFGLIPLDRQGKRVQSALRALFELASPKRLGRGSVLRTELNMAEIAIEFTPDMIWFEGHFPEQPVLAGIAQVHMATLWAEHLWGWRPQGAGLSQVKFRRILRPGDAVLLRLQRLSQRLKYSYELGNVIASEGTIGDAE
jgi:acyl-CoA synthetase (AMP-forming)/AMP-acid ligase II/3-hydroxymyristoyl/3-hydroxydecanoyl-(acyl carrier protein) dehydratase